MEQDQGKRSVLLCGGQQDHPGPLRCQVSPLMVFSPSGGRLVSTSSAGAVLQVTLCLPRDEAAL